MDWHKNRQRALRYVGSKIRLVPKIAVQLKATGADTLIDVFGGSGAVVMNAGFEKRVFNDRCSEVVNFFRVLSDPRARLALLKRLRRMPMSREFFAEFQKINMGGGADPITRAIALFYVSSFAFGGKVRFGGFVASMQDARNGIKEINRYFSVLRKLGQVARFWQNTVIEHLDFERLIHVYGRRPGNVLYCDPPYHGTERYYTERFHQEDHARLACALNACSSPVVLSYYASAELDRHYPETAGWRRVEIMTTKNSMGRGTSKRFHRSGRTVTELLLCRGV